MNCGFEEIVYTLPPEQADIEYLVNDTTIDKDVLSKMHANGLEKIHLDNDVLLHVLIRKTIKTLARKIKDLSKRTYNIIFAHSLPLLAPIDVRFIDMCIKGLGFTDAICYSINGQPCSIFHMAVQLAGYLVTSVPDTSGIVLIGADKGYSTDERFFFNSAMSDVVIAGFLTGSSGNNRILSSYSHSALYAYDGERSPAHQIIKFRQANPSFIRYAIENCLSKAGKEPGDLTYIVPHTPNKLIWDTVSELMKFPRNKILTKYLSETGHMNSNDSFVHYVRAVNEGLIKKGDIVILVNPGFGGTRGCTLISC